MSLPTESTEAFPSAAVTVHRQADRKRLIRVLAEHALPHLILDSVGDGIVVADTEGHFLLFNAAAQRIIGQGAVDRPIADWPRFYGLYLSDKKTLLHPDQLPFSPARLGETVDDMEIYLSNTQVPAAWLNLSSRPITHQGRLIGSVVTFRDITQKREGEERLRQLASVFENALDGVMVTDPRNRIVLVNPAFTRITGYSAQEIVGNSPSLLRSGRHDDDFYRELWAEVQTTGSWQGELWNRRQDGRIYAERLTIRVVRSETGEVLNYIGTFHDITERKQAEERVKRLAHYDRLTNLPNRTLFEERLCEALERAHRHQWPLSVIFLDLDRFKPVNDTLGHRAGDELLRQVSARLSRVMRDGDTVARLGGDEFAMVLEGLPPSHTTTVARRILQALTTPFQVEGQELYIGASLGISVYPQDGDDLSTLLKHADAAMYKAKERRNDFQFFSSEILAGAKERMTLEHDLRLAIDKQEIFLRYQPILDLTTNQPCGVEALLRWRHPTLGMISPQQFIPIAEETGLMVPIGVWLLQEACRQRAAWREMVPDSFRITINLSGRQTRSKELLMEVERALTFADLEPEQLDLEITEDMVLDDPEGAIACMNQLAGFGVQLSIDDFGTGYSSLSRLLHFPLCRLKIDQSFIQGLPHHPGNVAITRSIIALAHHMNMKTVGEGVETPEQLAFLQDQGCDEIQGYHYLPPQPAEAITRWLQTQLY